jgi:hypothetical protein
LVRRARDRAPTLGIAASRTSFAAWAAGDRFFGARRAAAQIS